MDRINTGLNRPPTQKGWGLFSVISSFRTMLFKGFFLKIYTGGEFANAIVRH